MLYDRRVNDKQVLALFDREGNLVGTWSSVKEAAAQLNVSKQTIYTMLDKKHRSIKIKGTFKVIDAQEVK